MPVIYTVGLISNINDALYFLPSCVLFMYNCSCIQTYCTRL